MRSDLALIEKLGTLGFTEEMRLKTRRYLCLAAYLICFDVVAFATGWPAMRPMEILFAAAATVLAIVAGGYNEVSIADRVEKRKKDFRKRLGTPEEDPTSPPPMRSLRSGEG